MTTVEVITQHCTRQFSKSPEVEVRGPAILLEELDIVRRSILHTITARKAGLDDRIQVNIGYSHPIQTWALCHWVNCWPIQTQLPRCLATKFESVNNLLGGMVPEFKLDGRIQY
jgi:hypothetical protein